MTEADQPSDIEIGAMIWAGFAIGIVFGGRVHSVKKRLLYGPVVLLSGMCLVGSLASYLENKVSEVEA